MTAGLAPALKLRWKRQRLLWRALRARHALTPVADRTGNALHRRAVPVFAVMHNEALRLPHWLDHHRALGAGPFLLVDHASTDETAAILADQPDVSVWRADGRYRDARFGMDWLGWLLLRYGHGRWCLTLDADELLVYPHHDRRSAADLTARLEATGASALGALMVELYPRGPIGDPAAPGSGPLHHLRWFDPAPFRTAIRPHRRDRRTQGGMRERVFFAGEPHRSPTLNKLPLVRWNRRLVYANATHSVLPPRVNDAWDGPGDPRLSGALLHTKMLPDAPARARCDRLRSEHFGHPDRYTAYFDALAAGPDLWHPGSVRYDGWQQLCALGLMADGGWT